jgi:carboxyl-terminal processing protease
MSNYSNVCRAPISVAASRPSPTAWLASFASCAHIACFVDGVQRIALCAAAVGRGVRLRLMLASAMLGLVISGCGGGGPAAGSTASSSGASVAGWQSGVFKPQSTFAAQCVAPRTGVDPFTNLPFPDRQGTLLDENNWLRSWTNDLYLWFDQLVDSDPGAYTTTASYFAALKTTQLTASGRPVDKFHFTYDTATWQSLSKSNVQVGYGAQWDIITALPPRKIVVAYTEPNSPATSASANLARGAQVLMVDGVDVVNAPDQASVNTINAGLTPKKAGETHTFEIQDLGSTTPRTVTLAAASITTTSVLKSGTIATGNGAVGYILFNDQLAQSEAGMIGAIASLQVAGITDLVLDIRYNGGGYLDIASEVAYMIAGVGPTSGQTFELSQFNSKHLTINPVTGAAIIAVPFHAVSQGFSSTLPSGQALPSLNLQRVYVLTGPDTCSASEAIINSLRGVGVQVIQIGSTTCGKPYGFYPTDNCSTTYFSIQFRGVNALNFGDYPDGFSPQNASPLIGVAVPGCSVADDLTHALGDPAEGRLAAALTYRASTSCPMPATGIAAASQIQSLGAVDGRLPISPVRQLRLLRR